jgi:hypothetical protein
VPWRYEPQTNRTPVNHPVLGHLAWGQIYDNPLCANDPNFVEVDDQDLGKRTRDHLNDLAAETGVPEPHKLQNKQAVIDAINAQAATADSAPEPDPAEGDEPADTAEREAADAGKTGRS